MNRLERLINLVAALLHAEQPLSAEEIRERVPGYPDDMAAFRRGFERDKQVLREMGVPITVAPVPDVDPPLDGYRIPKHDYYLDDPGLEGDELAALHLAASAVEVDGANGVEALWKLGGEVAEAGPTAARAALPGAAQLPTVFAAIASHRSVGFNYRDKPRTLDPYGLSFRNGHWYVGGRDHGSDELRSYRLDRFQSDAVAGDDDTVFEPRSMAIADDPPWQLGDEQPVLARVLVDTTQAGWAATHVGAGASAEWLDDGSVVLQLQVTNRDAFRSFVLGFLDHAEVLDPPELRADMVSWLETVAGS